jgi:hypothetical protein
VATQGKNIMKIGRARLINRPNETRGKKYNKYFIYLTSYLTSDKDFPFKEGDELIARIVEGKLVIEKPPE